MSGISNQTVKWLEARHTLVKVSAHWFPFLSTSEAMNHINMNQLVMVYN